MAKRIIAPQSFKVDHANNGKFRTVSSAELAWSPDGNPVVTLFYTDGSSETREVKRLLADGDGNTKLRKNRKRAFLTGGLALSPHTSAGIGNVCAFASPGCIDGCLDETGLGAVFEGIHIARQCKTVVWFKARDWFKARLATEVGKARDKAIRQNLDLCIRPNVFSDVPWEKQFRELFARYPDVWFYDYTKNPKRAGLIAPNYWVTFSRSEINEKQAIAQLTKGNNVAVVFAVKQEFDSDGNKIRTLPLTWRGFQVIDGDESDLRFLDPRGRIRGRVVGLHLKYATMEQRQASIDSGFAVRVNGKQ